MREVEMKEIRLNEINTNIHTDTRQQTLGGIKCPMTADASRAIEDLRRGAYNYLQFKIELQEEQIHLVKAGIIELSKLPSEVPDDHARYTETNPDHVTYYKYLFFLLSPPSSIRYHIYLFKHTHEGDYLENCIFIYSMPGYNCSVKERMMYSSCKAPFLESINALGLEIVKKVF